MSRLNKYPVNKSMCEGCSSCMLVTTTITGYHIEEDSQYYQCISEMEGECAGAYDISLEVEVNEAWTREDQAELDRMFGNDDEEYIEF